MDSNKRNELFFDTKRRIDSLETEIQNAEMKLKVLNNSLRQTKLLMYAENPTPVRSCDVMPELNSEVVVWKKDGAVSIIQVGELWPIDVFDYGWEKWAYLPF